MDIFIKNVNKKIIHVYYVIKKDNLFKYVFDDYFYLIIYNLAFFYKIYLNLRINMFRNFYIFIKF